jgi:hypothetical protein
VTEFKLFTISILRETCQEAVPKKQSLFGEKLCHILHLQCGETAFSIAKQLLRKTGTVTMAFHPRFKLAHLCQKKPNLHTNSLNKLLFIDTKLPDRAVICNLQCEDSCYKKTPSGRKLLKCNTVPTLHTVTFFKCI